MVDEVINFEWLQFFNREKKRQAKLHVLVCLGAGMGRLGMSFVNYLLIFYKCNPGSENLSMLQGSN